MFVPALVSRTPARLGRLGWMRVVLLFWLGLATACMQRSKSSAPPPPHRASGSAFEADDEDQMMMAESAPRGAPRAKRREMSVAAAPAVSGGQAIERAPAPARKVHYAGYARVRVGSVEAVTDQLTAKAAEWGGFVESVSGSVVTLRVPVDGFETSFQAITELGELLDRSITARDVTEAFTAVDLRLATARRTRDRLVELLARSEDEQEKLALIKQIQRVSEEIDRLEGQLRTLDSLANMSRITVELVPRQAQAWRDRGDGTAEMAWIRALSPFKPDLVSAGKRLDLSVPEGMVQLTPKRRFIAEGPDGARIWSGRLANEPAGDGAFWVDAIQARLGAEFSAAEVETVGGFTLLKLTDRGDSPYVWWIAIQPRGTSLDVVEIYFPTPAELERFGLAVRATLKAAGGGA